MEYLNSSKKETYIILASGLPVIIGLVIVQKFVLLAVLIFGLVILINSFKKIEFDFKNDRLHIHFKTLGVTYRTVTAQFDQTVTEHSSVKFLNQGQTALEIELATAIEESKPQHLSIHHLEKTHEVGSAKNCKEIFDHLVDQFSEI